MNGSNTVDLSMDSDSDVEIIEPPKRKKRVLTMKPFIEKDGEEADSSSNSTPRRVRKRRPFSKKRVPKKNSSSPVKKRRRAKKTMKRERPPSPLYLNSDASSQTIIDDASSGSEKMKFIESENDWDDFVSVRPHLQEQERKRNFVNIVDKAMKEDKRLKMIEKEFARRIHLKLKTDNVVIPKYLLTSEDPGIIQRLARLKERIGVPPKRFTGKPTRRQASPRSPVHAADIGELLSVDSDEMPELYKEISEKIRASATRTLSPMGLLWDHYADKHVYPKRLAQVFLKAGVSPEVVDELARVDVAARKPYKRN